MLPLCILVALFLKISSSCICPYGSRYGRKSSSSKCFGTCPTNNLTGSLGDQSCAPLEAEGGCGGGLGGLGSTVTDTVGRKSGGLSMTYTKVHHKTKTRDNKTRQICECDTHIIADS